MSPRFLTDLDVKLIDDYKGLWQLDNSFVYYSDVLGKLITVPAGFVTDFASGPSLFWVSLARDQGRKAATIHDWLYTSQICTREEADRVLQEALLASGYSSTTASMYYYAVRVGGGSHWTTPNQPQPERVQSMIDA